MGRNRAFTKGGIFVSFFIIYASYPVYCACPMGLSEQLQEGIRTGYIFWSTSRTPSILASNLLCKQRVASGLVEANFDLQLTCHICKVLQKFGLSAKKHFPSKRSFKFSLRFDLSDINSVSAF